MPTINDANGTPANVTTRGMVKALAVSESLEGHTNRTHGQAFTWQFSTAATAADDCIFYIKNTDDLPLILEGIDLFISDDCAIYLKLGGTGTTAAGTVVTGVAMNAGSGEVADVTCLYAEDVESGGTFTGATECNRYSFESGTVVDTHNINFPMDIVIPKNQVFSIWVDTASVVIKGTLYGFFHNGV